MGFFGHYNDSAAHDDFPYRARWNTKATVFVVLSAKYQLMCAKIHLREVQKPHVAALTESLHKHGLYIDTSDQGMGKSYCAMYLAAKEIAAKAPNRPPDAPLMLIISHPNSIAMWTNYVNKEGIPAIVATYGNIRSTRRAEANYCARSGARETPSGGSGHSTDKAATRKRGRPKKTSSEEEEPCDEAMQIGPMLTKHGIVSRENGSFSATEKLRNILRQGVMVLIDEFHNVQGKSAQAKAIQLITREVSFLRRTEPGLPSYIALLSNTPCLTRDHVLPLLRLTGIVTHERLYDGRGRKSLGLEELRQYCLSIDAAKTHSITRYRTLTAATATELAFKLYIDVLRDEISHHAESDFGMKQSVNIVQNISKEQFLSIAERVGRRAEAEEALADGRPLERGRKFNLQPVLEAVEVEKSKEFVQRAREILESDPTAKVAIYLWHTKPIEATAEALAAYDPILFNGSLPMQHREKARADFQEDSGRRRVILCHPVCASESISLDDQYGGRKRHVFISPCYRGQALAQIPGRFDRITTKSVAYIYLVFFEGFEEERNIYYSLRDKVRTDALVKGTEDTPLLFDTLQVAETHKGRWM